MVLSFELANRAYFAASVSDRGDEFYDQFTDRYSALLAEQEAGIGPEIARELYVTLNTLRTHTKRIFTKLDAKTRASAVHHARERGLL